MVEAIVEYVVYASPFIGFGLGFGGFCGVMAAKFLFERIGRAFGH